MKEFKRGILVDGDIYANASINTPSIISTSTGSTSVNAFTGYNIASYSGISTIVGAIFFKKKLISQSNYEIKLSGISSGKFLDCILSFNINNINGINTSNIIYFGDINIPVRVTIDQNDFCIIILGDIDTVNTSPNFTVDYCKISSTGAANTIFRDWTTGVSLDLSEYVLSTPTINRIISNFSSKTLGTNFIPAYNFADDSNTGIYSPGSDQLGLVTNGINRLNVSVNEISATLPISNNSETPLRLPNYLAATPSTPSIGDIFYDKSRLKIKSADLSTGIDGTLGSLGAYPLNLTGLGIDSQWTKAGDLNTLADVTKWGYTSLIQTRYAFQNTLVVNGTLNVHIDMRQGTAITSNSDSSFQQFFFDELGNIYARGSSVSNWKKYLYVNGTDIQFLKADGSIDSNSYALSSHNHSLNSLSNVTISANAAGEILKWNGTSWINNTLSEAGIQSTIVNNITGIGSVNYLSKFSASGVLTDSIISEISGVATINGTINVDNQLVAIYRHSINGVTKWYSEADSNIYRIAESGIDYPLTINSSLTSNDIVLTRILKANNGLVVIGSAAGSAGTLPNHFIIKSQLDSAIADLVNSSPGALDTLKELAEALGNDPNFATTITTSIASKQAQLNGNGFVKVVGTTISYDDTIYTSNLGTVTGIIAGTYLTGGTITTSGTISVDATPSNIANKIVARDASGNFIAGTITATISGNATTATTLQTSRQINGVSFNGSANITIFDATKEPVISLGTNEQYWRGDKTFQSVLDLPISIVTQTALDLKADDSDVYNLSQIVFQELELKSNTNHDHEIGNMALLFDNQLL